MQQPAAASNADADDSNRKAKLLALLDRARENRGLQPEQDNVMTIGQDEAMETKFPPIKTEPTTIKSEEGDTQNDLQPSPTSRGFNDTMASSRTNSSTTYTRVAILNSTPKPRIADLTGGNREKIPRLQQLKPLEDSRNKTHQPEEKHTIKRENPQLKQPRGKNAPSPNTSITLKKMELLTPDEYENSELHGDFQHMLHILIPANATTALLERRGQPIQSISQQTGCTLSIREPDASPFKDDRLLRIYGNAKCISLAQRLVVAYIRAYRAEKGDPNYMDLSDETPPVALPATSITKAMSVAVSSGKKNELEITSPFNWLVQREDVGKMMGRQGSILATIRRDTGAAIHIDEGVIPGTTERRVVLIGSVDSIAAAIEEIKSRSGGRPEVSATAASGRLGQYFAIPYHAAGYLIGPHGSTVQSINDRTGARLQIPSAEDLPLGSLNRILHVQGTPKQAEHARRVVGAKLRDYLASPMCPRTLTPSSTGRKGDKVTIKVLLPSKICGFMLDQRGKLIREISDKSGAYTYFLAPHDDENRVCVFTGDMSCVLRAQRLVLHVIAGDAISSKRVAPPRKRKRSQRDEEEEKDYAEVLDCMEEEEPYYEDEVEEEIYYDSEYEELAPRQPSRQPARRQTHDHEYDEAPRQLSRQTVRRQTHHHEYDEAPRQPVRRQPVRRQSPPRRPQHGYEEDQDQYRYADEMDEITYEERPRQPIRRRPIATRPREYVEEEYAHDEGIFHRRNDAHDGYRHNKFAHDGYHHTKYDHDGSDHDEFDHNDRTSYDAPRLRHPKKPAVVRRQPLRSRRNEFEEAYENYSDEYSYDDASEDDNEHSLVASKQMVKRRPVSSSRLDTQRAPVVLPGRKVQMVAPRLSPRESRSRLSPTDRRRTNGSGSVRPVSRSGSANARHSVPRGGRGNGRPSSSRGRGNGNKRRRQ